MRSLTLVALLLAGAVPVAAHAADVPAADDCAGAALPLLLHELPAEIQGLLGRGRAGIAGLADTNERFSATDALSINPAPMTRFRWAGQGVDCYAVTLERGGFMRHIETAVLRRVEGAWRVMGMRAPHPAEMGKPGNAPAPEADAWDAVDISKIQWRATTK
ncbi:hypothetical protein [Pseudoduganella chitinolytica]|uniref:DUF4019 domain-containing protein n=1 Tax=Pseudoduganella chitinolytica TaxID=34070 RepID=A0ABY8B975_9BURK|nr:hypothetical protein [Pseudoduganella chitinolytica]WEF30919.1 hypothetical protein PX653_15720 [Pseudoduganella chitinolytica]